MLARAKATSLGVSGFAFVREHPGDAALASATLTHGLLLHPVTTYGTLARGLGELARVLSPGGQALVAMPLRGSFPKLYDLLHEYTVRYGDDEFAVALERAQATRPTPEEFEVALESAGFEDITIAVDLAGLGFSSGAAFTGDPLARLVLMAELASWFTEPSTFTSAYAFAQDAIVRYFTGVPCRLTFNIGAASARRIGSLRTQCPSTFTIHSTSTASQPTAPKPVSTMVSESSRQRVVVGTRSRSGKSTRSM